MEDTDVDKIVKANFPSLDEHSKWLDGLARIAQELAAESLKCAKACKPLHAERRELFAAARKEGVDTKALKQMRKVINFVEKEIINAHERLGDDAGDTFAAMADQFSLPFSGVRPGVDLIAEAKKKAAEAKAKKADEIKAQKEKAKKAKEAENAKNLKAMGGKAQPKA